MQYEMLVTMCSEQYYSLGIMHVARVYRNHVAHDFINKRTELLREEQFSKDFRPSETSKIFISRELWHASFKLSAQKT